MVPDPTTQGRFRTIMRSALLKLSRALFKWPPESSDPSVKQAMVARLGRDTTSLVETGTYRGDMIDAQLDNFDTIVTIELDDDLFAAAEKKYEPHPHVSVLHGDSGQLMGQATAMCNGPATFWLDGHYSGGVTAGRKTDPPIVQELAIIAARKDPADVILIDDARLFGWRRGYPRIATVKAAAKGFWPDHRFGVESDIICIVPMPR
jgi:hypothetical protein